MKRSASVSLPRDEAAFDLLVGRYQGRAYRLAWSMLRDAEDARDVSQEAFLRVYRTAGSFRGDARFSTWFYRILVNLCLDQQRRGSWWRRVLVRDDGTGTTEGAALDRLPATTVDPNDTVGRAETMTRLWARSIGSRHSSAPPSSCTCRKSCRRARSPPCCAARRRRCACTCIAR
jgi:RNA polymerase sigma factor (sigma-70 family)